MACRVCAQVAKGKDEYWDMGRERKVVMKACVARRAEFRVSRRWVGGLGFGWGEGWQDQSQREIS